MSDSQQPPDSPPPADDDSQQDQYPPARPKDEHVVRNVLLVLVLVFLVFILFLAIMAGRGLYELDKEIKEDLDHDRAAAAKVGDFPTSYDSVKVTASP